MSSVTPPQPASFEPADPAATAPAAACAWRTSAACESALGSVAAHARFWTVAVLGLTADLWSKHWAFGTLGQGGHRTLISGVLELQTTLNSGALFGIGAGRTGLFVVASVLALALVLWMFAQCPRRRWLVQFALGAILAGALGNMYDRVFVQLYEIRSPVGGRRGYVLEDEPGKPWVALREYPPEPSGDVRRIPRADLVQLGTPTGFVRDFIKISTQWLGKWDVWPWVFNVADMLLVSGVAVLALRMLRDRRPRVETTGRGIDSPTGAS